MGITLNTKDIIHILNEAGYEPFRYSGRGMFGRECVAISVDTNGFSVALAVIKTLVEQMSDYEQVLVSVDTLAELEVRQDSLGRGQVIYFPRLEWKAEETEPEE